MAKNANAPYTGPVTYVMESGTPNVAVAKVIRGSVDTDENTTVEQGIGMQTHSTGGGIGYKLNFEGRYPLKTFLNAHLRTTVTNRVTAKNFVVGNEDGGWLLTGCQPASLSMTCGAPDGPFGITSEWWAATPTEDTTSSIVQLAVSGGLDEAWSTFASLLDAAAYMLKQWTINVNNNARFIYSQDGGGAGAKRKPIAVRLGSQVITLELQCYKELAGSVLLADLIDNDMDLTLTGTGLTIAASDLNTPTPGIAFDPEGEQLFTYRFTSNSQFGLSLT